MSVLDLRDFPELRDFAESTPDLRGRFDPYYEPVWWAQSFDADAAPFGGEIAAGIPITI